MKPSLQVRLSQHLALTPQLQQSIRLLQLSTLELNQEVEQMLASNPLLETEEEFGVAAMEVSAPELAPSRNQEAEAGAAESSPGEAETPTEEMRAEDFGTTEREDWENGTESDDFDGIRELPSSSPGGSGQGDEDGERPEQEAPSLSLQEHLYQQMAGMMLGPEDRAALQVLIESLNEDGYLADSLDEIAQSLAGEDAAAEDLEELQDRLRCALKWLQSMEPVGVGARDLAECLVLQLRSLPRSPAQAVAILICKQYLELLAKRDAKRLMSLTGADEPCCARPRT